MPFDSLPTLPPPVSDQYDQVLSVLIQARERIRVMGWTQFAYMRRFEGRERYCIVGAVRMEASCDREAERAIQALHDALPIWTLFPSVVTWNDAPWRRKRTVIRIFDRAIARRRAALLQL